jgi:hypothetical protein
MIPTKTPRRRLGVLFAVALVVVLAALIAVRVAARAPNARVAPAAHVPSAAPFALADLPTPYCWGCSDNQDAPLDFQIDLDLLAPLGDGAANAALWFKDFARDGARFETDGKSAKARRVEITIDDTPWRVLPGDDPLLLEAEPWVDQAACRFHPDVFKVDGVSTRLPDLLLMLDLSRSWVARGKLSADSVSALEDFRRAIRLGRLLRQDDVTLIQDLVAIACIRLGAEAMYELAREQGDAATMVATSLVLADKDGIRLATMRRMALLEPAVTVEDDETGEPSLHLTDGQLDSIVGLTRRLRDRRFRMEGLIGLHITQHLGTPTQREKAHAALEELARDADELLADSARYFREAPFDAQDFMAVLGP